MKHRLAIITTHPIQYNAPWFRLLNESHVIQPKVFYTLSQANQKAIYDPGFGKTIEWDIPLLEGYEYEFVPNVSAKPGTRSFLGIVNPELIARVNTWAPDFLLVFGWNFKSHLELMRSFRGKIPILFRGDSTLLDEKPGIRTLTRRLALKWVFRNIDYALAVGTNNKDYFLKHGLREAQIRIAHHSVDTHRFETGEDTLAIQDFRKAAGADENDFLILYAGKFEKKKAPGFIIGLARSLRSEPGIKFLMVGNGALEPELKKAAGNDLNIVFLPFQNQGSMPSLYKSADLFILPSIGPGETWGLAVNEAMACRLPVIATDKVGGAIDLIEQHRNGIVISPGDVTAARDYILKLKRDPVERKTAGNYSYSLIRKFDMRQIVTILEDILVNHKKV